MPAFESPEFVLEDHLVEMFVQHFDGNTVHQRGNKNEVLPENTAPGMLVVSLAAKYSLKHPAFEKILCARGAEVKFKAPTFRGDRLFVRGTFEDSPHKEREGVNFRSCECEVVRKSDQKVVLVYTITQLMKA